MKFANYVLKNSYKLSMDLYTLFQNGGQYIILLFAC